MQKEIYEKYIKKILKKTFKHIKLGVATPEEIAMLPKLLKVTAKYYLP